MTGEALTALAVAVTLFLAPITTPLSKGRSAICFILSALILGLAAWLYFRPVGAPSAEKKAQEQAGLFVDCRSAPPLSKVPASGIYFATTFWPEGGPALERRAGNPGSSVLVSPQPLETYLCTITNHSGKTVTDVDLNFDVSFVEVLDVPDQHAIKSGAVIKHTPWPLTIPKIDAGKDNAFELYLYNTSPNFVRFAISPQAAATSLTGAKLSLRVSKSALPYGMMTPHKETPPLKKKAAGRVAPS